MLRIMRLAAPHPTGFDPETLKFQTMNLRIWTILNILN